MSRVRLHLLLGFLRFFWQQYRFFAPLLLFLWGAKYLHRNAKNKTVLAIWAQRGATQALVTFAPSTCRRRVTHMGKTHSTVIFLRKPIVLVVLAIPCAALWIICGLSPEPILKTFGMHPSLLTILSIPAVFVFIVFSLAASIKSPTWRILFGLLTGTISTFTAFYLVLAVGCILSQSSCI